MNKKSVKVLLAYLKKASKIEIFALKQCKKH